MPAVAGVGTSPIVEFVRMLVNTFDYAGGWIGLFGWVDTPAPAVTIGAWTIALSAIIIPAYFVARPRDRWAIVLLGTGLILTPVISQAAVVTTSGYIWQGRYTLALLAMLLVGCGICLDRVKRGSFADSTVATRLTRGLLFTLLAAMAAGQLAAFVITLRRYTIGSEKALQLMITHPEWQPPLGWVTLTLIFVLIVACSSILIGRTVLRQAVSV
jgi:hypothetical protein